MKDKACLACDHGYCNCCSGFVTDGCLQIHCCKCGKGINWDNQKNPILTDDDRKIIEIRRRYRALEPIHA